MLTIVDYGTGNLRSVQNMLKSLGIAARISSARAEILEASALILPGVGHFDFGMRSLKQLDLRGVLDEQVLERKVPLLGICLGAQLLTRGSEEGTEPGLGWIAADTRRFDRGRMDVRLRVPHMGWAHTQSLRDNPLSPFLPADARFYYVHSYHLVCDREDDAIYSAWHGYEFIAGVQRGNVLGVQFHPEKSHRFGRRILENFVAWLPASAPALESST